MIKAIDVGFDRTYEELKHTCRLSKETGKERSFDRTYEELKLASVQITRIRWSSFDRTYEELKPRYPYPYTSLYGKVLIVPMRN